MFYETKHSMGAGDLITETGEDFQFPPHLHKAFEFITVTEGKMTVRVGKNAYEITPGQAILVFPEQIHSLETPEHSRHFLTIFSPDYVKAFAPFFAEHTPDDNLFSAPAELSAALGTLRKEDGILHIKSVLYSLLDRFDRTATYHARVPEKETLLVKIFDYVGRNFAGECTLKSLSEEMRYHYVYLSRYFTERTGISFSEYVSDRRISESCERLLSTSDSVTKIALECGFDSLRSFHRNFRARTGQTPLEYRQSQTNKIPEETAK